MAYFPRQKRQARFYWAELGFLVMGLFALQPSLLTSLFSGAMPRASSYVDRLNYPASQNFAGSMGRDWTGSQMVQSYMASPQTWQNQSQSNLHPQYLANSNLPLMTASYQPSYSQYNGMGYSGLPLQNANSWNGFHSHTQPQSDFQGYLLNNLTAQGANSYPQTSANAWQSQPTYVAQGNGTSANYNRGGSTVSNWPANNSTNPFNSLITKPQQSNLFRGGQGAGSYGSDNSLSNRVSPSAQRYPYPSVSTGYDSWTPYQPTGNSLYR